MEVAVSETGGLEAARGFSLRFAKFSRWYSSNFVLVSSKCPCENEMKT